MLSLKSSMSRFYAQDRGLNKWCSAQALDGVAILDLCRSTQSQEVEKRQKNTGHSTNLWIQPKTGAERLHLLERS
jgi:hypothetical protein